MCVESGNHLEPGDSGASPGRLVIGQGLLTKGHLSPPAAVTEILISRKIPPISALKENEALVLFFANEPSGEHLSTN